MEIEKSEYLENKKSFLDKTKKTFFVIFERVSFSEKLNFDEKQLVQALLNGKMMTLTNFELYTAHIKKSR